MRRPGGEMLAVVGAIAVALGIAVGSAIWAIVGRPSPNVLATIGVVLAGCNIAAVLWSRHRD